MWGSKTKELELTNKKLDWEIKRLEREVRTLQLDNEDIKSSRGKWRRKARSLRQQRSHLLQQLQLQGAAR